MTREIGGGGLARAASRVALAGIVGWSGYAAYGLRLEDGRTWGEAVFSPTVLFLFLNGMAVVWHLAYLGFRPEDRGAGVVGLALNWAALGSADLLVLACWRWLRTLEGKTSLAEVMAEGLFALFAMLLAVLLCLVSAAMNLVMLWWLARASRRERWRRAGALR
ncbi:MAG: hypothetical protein ACYS9X_02735 [Planctomycetota bacterium]|jgi:hypothetical protein